ncbi:hypothetical protein [Actinomadura sp. 9N215]|uniref:hypothetical protein n=1 Tax=Actinomadura sp. 9N215 TaxID=3375150 RepID=UPI00379BEF67
MAARSPLEEALRALRDDWEGVTRELDEEARAQLIELVREYRGAEPDERPDVALHIAMFLGEVLPRDHPVRRALAEGDSSVRGVGTADPSLDVQAEVDALFAELDELAAAGSARAQAVWEAKARLLSFPTVTAAELRERGADPAAHALVRLTDPAGEQRLPAFQFDADGRPLPVVLRINEILGARTDPWGVASWWLDPNARLRDAPFRLLGRMPDEDLTAAASAVVEDGD